MWFLAEKLQLSEMQFLKTIAFGFYILMQPNLCRISMNDIFHHHIFFRGLVDLIGSYNFIYMNYLNGKACLHLEGVKCKNQLSILSPVTAVHFLTCLVLYVKLNRLIIQVKSHLCSVRCRPVIWLNTLCSISDLWVFGCEYVS